MNPGDSDAWTDLGNGTWRVRAWILRPFENQPDLFAPTVERLDAMIAEMEQGRRDFSQDNLAELGR